MEIGPGFNEQIIALVGEVIPAKFRNANITHETHLQRDLGMDSLMRTMLMVRLEQHFGITVSDEAMGTLGTLRTVGDVIDASRRIAQGAG